MQRRRPHWERFKTPWRKTRYQERVWLAGTPDSVCWLIWSQFQHPPPSLRDRDNLGSPQVNRFSSELIWENQNWCGLPKATFYLLIYLAPSVWEYGATCWAMAAPKGQARQLIRSLMCSCGDQASHTVHSPLKSRHGSQHKLRSHSGALLHLIVSFRPFSAVSRWVSQHATKGINLKQGLFFTPPRNEVYSRYITVDLHQHQGFQRPFQTRSRLLRHVIHVK